ncbi:DMT family transporter [Nioella sediminis]|uniref:DMT family transporter n=1 Tax=Nioella sediminis TaxID=1912092 RepID=UPI0008FCFBE8|nr:DMT family transporter [Nioella sediminis]TBX19896.1 membrane protein [Roseovarius sp. JS7-11]
MSGGYRGHLAMLAFSALVAGSFSLGSMTANHIDPAAFNAVRFLCGAVVVSLIVQARGGFRRTHFHAPWRYLILGGLFGAYFVLMFEGLKTAPPVSAAAVFTLTPIMTAGFGFLLLSQLMTGRMALALAIGGAGALWVIFRADMSALLAFEIGRGEVIYFIGCISHAIYTPMVRMLNRGEPAPVSTFGTMLGGAFVLFLWGGAEVLATDWVALPGIVWVTLFYTAVFATAITVVLLQFASMQLPASKVMAYTYLTPTWVIGWEYFLGNGLPTVYVLGGVALTVLALLLLLKNDG